MFGHTRNPAFIPKQQFQNQTRKVANAFVSGKVNQGTIESSMKPIIEVKNVGKKYRLGAIGAQSLREEFGTMWNRTLGLRSNKSGTENDTNNKGLRDFWALKSVSFSVSRGDVLGIVGLNGAGKSTLLKILSRITDPTEGEVILRGRLASLLEVGTGFHPELSGRDNVFLNGAILGMKRGEIAKRFSQIVEFAGVEKFIDTPVKRYSSGMYVRLAFAVAVHLEPEILIVDEVLAVGDFLFQAKCVEKMRQLTNSGKTILFVSHNLYALQTLCKSGLLLKQGRVESRGSVQDAISAFRSQSEAKDTISDNIEGIACLGDVKLISVEINGRSDAVIDVRDTVLLEIKWRFSVRTAQILNFGFSIKSVDGAYISGLSTFVEEMPRHFESGHHFAGIVIPDLDLPSGSYKLSLAVMDCNGVAIHSYRDSVAILSVVRTFRFDGMVGIRHEWILPAD